MWYSLEPITRKYVKGYGFLSFAINFLNKYRKQLFDTGIMYNQSIICQNIVAIILWHNEACGIIVGMKWMMVRMKMIMLIIG